MERNVSGKSIDGDGENIVNRPQSFQDFIGQRSLKDNLSIFIEAAKKRNETLDHVLFYGPPGLGKTTLSQIIARELNSNIRITSGPVLTKVGDLAAILTNLQFNDVLFIDEIHRLNIAIEELLYSAMEDFAIDIIVGDGPAARTIRINLPPFTLIGATTRLGLLTNPLKDRFGISMRLNFYDEEELQSIVKNQAQKINLKIIPEAVNEIACRSRGTPRIALRLLRRIRDFAEISEIKIIDQKFIDHVLKNLQIDKKGLDKIDHKYINYIANNYGGGPVGIETIASALSEDVRTIEETIEPFLIQIGFVNKTPRGRLLSAECLQYMQDM